MIDYFINKYAHWPYTSMGWDSQNLNWTRAKIFSNPATPLNQTRFNRAIWPTPISSDPSLANKWDEKLILKVKSPGVSSSATTFSNLEAKTSSRALSLEFSIATNQTLAKMEEHIWKSDGVSTPLGRVMNALLDSRPRHLEAAISRLSSDSQRSSGGFSLLISFYFIIPFLRCMCIDMFRSITDSFAALISQFCWMNLYVIYKGILGMRLIKGSHWTSFWFLSLKM